jgi:hypothetical protein
MERLAAAWCRRQCESKEGADAHLSRNCVGKRVRGLAGRATGARRSADDDGRCIDHARRRMPVAVNLHFNVGVRRDEAHNETHATWLPRMNVIRRRGSAGSSS